MGYWWIPSFPCRCWIAGSKEVGAEVSREEVYEVEGAKPHLGIEWLFEKAG
jgi:hypothetical protein